MVKQKYPDKGSYVLKNEAMEAMTPSVKYSWGWGHSSFICAIG